MVEKCILMWYTKHMKKLSVAVFCILILCATVLGAASCVPVKKQDTPSPNDYSFFFSSHKKEAEDTFYESLYQMKEEEKKSVANVSIFDLGNSIMSDSVSYATKTVSELEIMRASGYGGIMLDAKDFLSDKDVIFDLPNQKIMPVLTGNLLRANGEKLFPNAYQIIEQGGKKIGVFGVADPEWAKEIPIGIRAEILFGDPAEYTKEILKKFEESGVAIIIALTSSRSEKFLASICDAGKIHFVVDAGRTGEDITVSGTAVTSVGRGDTVKRVGIEYNSDRTAFRLVTEERKLPTPTENTVSAVKKQVALQAGADLNASVKDLQELTGSASAESPLGKLATSAMIFHSGADVAVLPAVAVGNGIAANAYSVKNIFASLPALSAVYTVKVKGADVQAYFSKGNFGGYNFSGVAYSMGNGQCKVNQIPLDMNSEYTVAYCEGFGQPFPSEKESTPIAWAADAIFSYLSEVTAEGIMAAIAEPTAA